MAVHALYTFASISQFVVGLALRSTLDYIPKDEPRVAEMELFRADTGKSTRFADSPRRRALIYDYIFRAAHRVLQVTGQAL
jgi:hypothetical protein